MIDGLPSGAHVPAEALEKFAQENAHLGYTYKDGGLYWEGDVTTLPGAFGKIETTDGEIDIVSRFRP